LAPLVSVIIPNYNHYPFLEQRIESVLNQTFQDFELIILDDYSTDNSKDIIEHYHLHPKVSRIEYNNNNSGSPFKQWLKGIQIAKGEYIWIAESDDYSDSAFLETMLLKIAAYPQVALVYCDSHVVNAENKILDFQNWGHDLDDKRWENDYINKGDDEISNYLLYKNTIVNASAVIFKKELFLHIDTRLFIDLMFTGDWMIWVNLLRNDSIAYLAKKLNYFRFHQESTRSVKSIKDEIKRVKEYFKVINFIEKNYSIKANSFNHLWIINEWYNKWPLLKQKPITFFFPPFKYRYICIFYSYLFYKKRRLNKA